MGDRSVSTDVSADVDMYRMTLHLPFRCGVSELFVNWLSTCIHDGVGSAHLIPELNSKTGLLPFVETAKKSTYQCSLSELESRFAITRRRQEIFGAFEIWVREFEREVAGVKVWIAGSYVTSKEEPNDLDVCAVIPDGLDVKQNTRVLARWNLQTLQRVRLSSSNVTVRRLQPIAGLVDGFLLSSAMPETVALFREDWTTVWKEGARTSQRKGMLEVQL